MGAGPCLCLCGPLLISQAIIHESSLRKSVFSYLVFSGCKILGYLILSIICFAGFTTLNNIFTEKYSRLVYLIMGIFIFLTGTTAFIYSKNKIGKSCQWFSKGSIRNLGILGILVGIAPCLPLLGILNYILLVSETLSRMLVLSFIFGLGTVISPLFIIIIVAGKLSEKMTKNKKIQTIINVLSGIILLILGGKIILQTLKP